LTRRGRKAALAALLLLAPSAARADSQTSASAAVGGRWLNILNNPRSAGMGGAGTALARGAGSLGADPAGLADGQAGLETSYLGWDDDITLQRLAYAQPLGAQGLALGLDLDYVDMGSVESFSVVNGSPVQQPDLHPHAGALGAALALPLGGGLEGGAEAKALFQDLGQGDSYAGAADLGLRWYQGPTGAALGAALLNAGSSLEGANLPLQASVGGAWTQPLRPGSLLRAALDLRFTPQTDETAALTVGGEYVVNDVAQFRAGYLVAAEGSPSGPSAGLSVSLGPWLSADYAYSSLGGEPANQLGLRANWGGAPAPAMARVPMPTAVAPAPAAPVAPSPTAQAAEASPQAQVAVTIDKLITAVENRDAAASQALTQDMLTQGPELRARMAQAVQADGVAPSVFNGEFQRAEAYLRAMTRLQRDNAYAWMALGTVLWFQDRVPESLECYQKSYLLDPTQAFVAARIKQLGGALPTP